MDLFDGHGSVEIGRRPVERLKYDLLGPEKFMDLFVPALVTSSLVLGPSC